MRRVIAAGAVIFLGAGGLGNAAAQSPETALRLDEWTQTLNLCQHVGSNCAKLNARFESTHQGASVSTWSAGGDILQDLPPEIGLEIAGIVGLAQNHNDPSIVTSHSGSGIRSEGDTILSTPHPELELRAYVTEWISGR